MKSFLSINGRSNAHRSPVRQVPWPAVCSYGIMLFIACLGLLAGPVRSDAQFLRLTFDIDSEFVAEEMNPLTFGEVVPDAGVIRIPMGDPDMGTYSISGPQNLTVQMNLDIPEYLELDGESPARVPMNLEAAFANRNQNNIDHAVLIDGRMARFQMREDAPPPERPDQPAPSATAFIYVYGEIEVGDIPPGTYDGTVYMTVEYE